jgi:hypothetical protein
VFVNALVENPSFDSQTKETLTTRPRNFGSDCQLSSRFLDTVLEKTRIVDTVYLTLQSFGQLSMVYVPTIHAPSGEPMDVHETELRLGQEGSGRT